MLWLRNKNSLVCLYGTGRHHSVLTGVQAYADALLVIIKVLAQNAGLDPQEAIVKLQEEYTGPQQAVGLDIKTGEDP